MPASYVRTYVVVLSSNQGMLHSGASKGLSCLPPSSLEVVHETILWAGLQAYFHEDSFDIEPATETSITYLDFSTARD